MKNKYLYFLQVVIIFFFMIVESVSLEDELVFNTAKIEISDNGSIIYAENGDIFSKKHNITISAKKFKYNKKLSILEANGDIELKDLNEDIILKAQKIFFNIGNETIEVSDNINIRDLNKNISIKTQKVFYNIVNKTIESGTNSVIEDDSNNLFSTENFFFTLDDDLIKLGATKLIDAKKNIMFIEKSYINLNSKKLIGKDISIDAIFTSIEAPTANVPVLIVKVPASATGPVVVQLTVNAFILKSTVDPKSFVMVAQAVSDVP